jgi:hypothetical protein
MDCLGASMGSSRLNDQRIHIQTVHTVETHLITVIKVCFTPAPL